MVTVVISPNKSGRVRWQGSFWRAQCLQNLSLVSGQAVYVVGIQNLTLLVEPIHDVTETDTGSNDRTLATSETGLEGEPEKAEAEYESLIGQLEQLLGGAEKAEIWLNSPHPALDGRTPQSYLDEGKLEVLEYFIHAIETGQPT